MHVFGAAYDPLAPVSNGRCLAERIPGSLLSILSAGQFAWEELPDQFAGFVADLVTRTGAGTTAAWLAAAELTETRRYRV